jgi:hypothetical protein
MLVGTVLDREGSINAHGRANEFFEACGRHGWYRFCDAGIS